MPSYDYHAASSLAEAVSLLGQYGSDAHVMAGGTSLVLLINQGLVQPGHVVGLRGIGELRGIERTGDGGLRIGALATHRDVERSPLVREYSPALSQAFSLVATIRIRNQGTGGGNLAHADPAQDPPPILMALDAQVDITGPNGNRTIPISDLFVDFFETSLEEGEILTAVRLPAPPAGLKAVYKKFLPSTADAYATVSVAAAGQVDQNNVCQEVRIALGSAATTPLRANAAEDVLRGQPLTEERIKEAAALVRDAVDPLDDVRGSASYKREMAGVWTARALRELAWTYQATSPNGSAARG